MNCVHCVAGDNYLCVLLGLVSQFYFAGTHAQVFARMTPDSKERVIVALKDHKHFPLMCGDGANDVGALKQVC